MRYLSVFILSYVLLAANRATGEDWASALFSIKSHDFGTIAVGAKAEYAFVMKNDYAKEIHVAAVRSSCGCSDVEIQNATLQPYENGAIVASVNSERLRGRQTSTITVVFDRPAYAEVQLYIKVFIRGDMLLTPASIEFGELPLGKSAEKQLTVTRYGDPDWKLLDVTCDHPHLRASVEEISRTRREVSYCLTVSVDDQAPDGFLNEAVLLTTTDGEGMRVPVLVQGRIIPKIAVAPQDLFVGVLAPGQTATRQIIVRSDEPFQILAITAECGCFEFTLPEKPTSKKLHIVPVKFKADGPQRGFNRVIRIQTDAGYTAELVAHAGVKAN